MTMLDNVNRALAEIGTRSRLTVVDSSTTEGLYASLLYPMLRDSMLRMGDYDWSMELVPAGISEFVGAIWPFAYDYPANTVRIRQALPILMPFDPVPVEWGVFTNFGLKFIGSKTPILEFVITANNVVEELWDAQFTDAFIRYFGAAMTMALENRLEASETVLKNAIGFAGIANMRDS